MQNMVFMCTHGRVCVIVTVEYNIVRYIIHVLLMLMLYVNVLVLSEILIFYLGSLAAAIRGAPHVISMILSTPSHGVKI